MGLTNLNGRLAYEPERSLAAGSISSSYAAVGSAFSHPIRILVLQNQTDVAITFSLDGTNDTITLQSKIAFTFDVCANRTEQNSFIIASGTRVWVKGSPSSGDVYISAFYATGPTS